MFMKISTAIITILGILSIAFLLSLVLALPVMWLWNSTLIDLFGFKEITLWTAWKISLLSAFLFRGFTITTSKDS